MTFALDIKNFVEKCGKNADQVVDRVVKDVMESIMEMSPVGNPSIWEGWNKGGVSSNQDHWLVNAGFVGEGYVGGHFRANWQLGIGSLPTGMIEGIDKEGKITLSKAYAIIPPHAAGLVYYFGNNLPYAIPLEEGHSKTAPNGMVGLTALRFNDFINKAVAELK